MPRNTLRSPSNTKDVFVSYTDSYQEECFKVWFGAGCPDRLTSIVDLLPKDESQRVVGIQVLRRWREHNNWDIRADELNARAAEKSDDEMVRAKADMLARQAEAGHTLQSKGLDYIEDKGFDSAASAVNAVIRGAELERSSRGMSQLLIKLSKMSDADVVEELKRLASRAESGEAIDATEVEVSDTESQIENEESTEEASSDEN